jgi:LPXTG-motif cell wall-anchored protein
LPETGDTDVSVKVAGGAAGALLGLTRIRLRKRKVRIAAEACGVRREERGPNGAIRRRWKKVPWRARTDPDCEGGIAA